eukprot:gb/GFBE01081508.1/.p1 GENE.gb/GFBE01081508.1/~~gb/GFBE01081508.1/.p1  ORF type:complete len:202 (+),score=29.11 gb/GFBE01081508.1/:1-606(+)
MDDNKFTRTVYVGNLPDDIRVQDIEYLFGGFGLTGNIDIKRGPGSMTYAFIVFRNPRDAAAAVHRRDGYEFEGEPLRVELKDGFGKSKGRGKGKGFSKGKTDRIDEPETPLIILGVPEGTQWMHLKDHMRQAGDVAYCDIKPNGQAQVSFYGFDAAQRAVDELDRSLFRDPDGRKVELRVRWPDDPSPGRSRSRGRIPRRL